MNVANVVFQVNEPAKLEHLLTLIPYNSQCDKPIKLSGKLLEEWLHSNISHIPQVVSTTLMNEPIVNLLEFHFQRQPNNYCILYHPTPNAIQQITNQRLFQVQPGHFFAPKQLY